MAFTEVEIEAFCFHQTPQHWDIPAKIPTRDPGKNIVKAALFVPDSGDRDPPLPNVGQKAMNLIREGLSTLL